MPYGQVTIFRKKNRKRYRTRPAEPRVREKYQDPYAYGLTASIRDILLAKNHFIG